MRLSICISPLFDADIIYFGPMEVKSRGLI